MGAPFSEHLETTPNRSDSLQVTNEVEELDQASTISELQAEINASLPPSDLLHGISTAVPHFQELSVSAKAVTEAERRMTFLAGCRLYPKAIAWSVLVSSATIMEAYDKSLVSNFFGFPEFRRAYGTQSTRVLFRIATGMRFLPRGSQG
jgi:SP family general alpha glucoside:H+ symporter-like MFS transporter